MPVVIGAPDVNYDIEAAPDELVPVIGDVAGVVRGVAIGADDYVVLIFAELAGGEPEGTFFVGQEALLTKDAHGDAVGAFRVVE